MRRSNLPQSSAAIPLFWRRAFLLSLTGFALLALSAPALAAEPRIDAEAASIIKPAMNDLARRLSAGTGSRWTVDARRCQLQKTNRRKRSRVAWDMGLLGMRYDRAKKKITMFCMYHKDCVQITSPKGSGSAKRTISFKADEYQAVQLLLQRQRVLIGCRGDGAPANIMRRIAKSKEGLNAYVNSEINTVERRLFGRRRVLKMRGAGPGAGYNNSAKHCLYKQTSGAQSASYDLGQVSFRSYRVQQEDGKRMVSYTLGCRVRRAKCYTPYKDGKPAQPLHSKSYKLDSSGWSAAKKRHFFNDWRRLSELCAPSFPKRPRSSGDRA